MDHISRFFAIAGLAAAQSFRTVDYLPLRRMDGGVFGCRWMRGGHKR